MVSPCFDPGCASEGVEQRERKQPAPYGSEPCYHGNLSLLASVENLSLHLLSWRIL